MNNKLQLLREGLRSKTMAKLLYYAKFGSFYSDRKYLERVFPLRLGYPLNLDNPRTFSEKLQWLKLYNRNPEYVKMVDKIEAKKYVASIIGEEYIVPTYATYNSVEEIDFDALPERFVLKTTHVGGSVGVVICHDKSHFDKEAAKKNLRIAMKRDHSKLGREWVYSQIKPRIIAEQLLEVCPDGIGDIPDYKWYCFNGEPKYCQVIQDRSSNETIDFFDTEWNHQEFVGLNPAAGPATVSPAKPANLETQIHIARELSKDIPFSRIDLYESGGDTYFGEITLYPASGFGVFRPDQYNEILGTMINLPGTKREWVIIRQLQNSSLQITEPDLPDYKFFCFDGEVKALFVGSERQTGDVKFDFFDADFNHLDFVQGHPQLGREIPKPAKFELMKEIAGKLSKGLPHARIDLYDTGKNIYFGEITFFHFSGFTPFEPEKWDYTFGSWLTLPNKKQ